jgi:hypothetical protein
MIAAITHIATTYKIHGLGKNQIIPSEPSDHKTPPETAPIVTEIRAGILFIFRAYTAITAQKLPTTDEKPANASTPVKFVFLISFRLLFRWPDKRLLTAPKTPNHIKTIAAFIKHKMRTVASSDNP